jgi:hypothetical protein
LSEKNNRKQEIRPASSILSSMVSCPNMPATSYFSALK